MPKYIGAFLLALLLTQPLSALAQSQGEYRMNCTAGYTGPLDPGEKRDIITIPQSECYRWVEPYLTARFRQFYPPSAYELRVITPWTESLVEAIFLVAPISDSKKVSPDVMTVIGKQRGKWKDMHEVALETRVALMKSVQEVMAVCERSSQCDIFKMSPMRFANTVQGEQ